MKKTVCILFVLSLLFLLPSCRNTGENVEDVYDVDMIGFSSTMVYSRIYNVWENYGNYVGKTVRMPGIISYGENPDGTVDYLITIADTTACCSISFLLEFEEERTFPDDFPQNESQVVVSGVFSVFDKDEKSYLQLNHVKIQ